MLSKLTLLGFSSIALGNVSTRQDQNIRWTACPDVNKELTLSNAGIQGATFDCASLQVPLDYTDDNSAPLQLSLFKLNATKEPVLGSVIANFGGPGGTGAENLPLFGPKMAENIGPQWNIISWDPRGTGKTIPFSCGSLSDPTTNVQKRAVPLVSANLTEYFVNSGWNEAGRKADICYAMNNDTGRFISTASTARDVIKIVDALGEDGLLRYYGWSYGTALGNYLAAMFPDRVERIVLDGNLNPWDYQAGHYGSFLEDADATYRGFLSQCIENKNNCSLAQFTKANTVDELSEAINQAEALLVPQAGMNESTWAIYGGGPSIIFSSLYYPANWPSLADTVTSFLDGSYKPPQTSNTTGTYNKGTAAVFGVRGGDALWRPQSIEEYLPQVRFQDTVSSFDTPWSGLWVSARWKITPKDQYKGGFSIKTKNPILYVNGQFDPVTPLSAAQNASKGFEGSRVLAHSGYGHGSIINPSACVAKYVQAYYIDGSLPEEGVVCAPDLSPWELAYSPRSKLGVGNGTTPGVQNPGNQTSGTPPSPTSSPVLSGTASLHSEPYSFAAVAIMALFSILFS